MRPEVSLEQLHIAFDQALQVQSCHERWPKVYKAMIEFKFDLAQDWICDFAHGGWLSEEGAEKCLAIIDEIRAARPRAIS